MKQLIIKDITSNSMTEADHLYARSFRWLMYTDRHPDIHTWMKRLKMDHVKKQIYFEAYEDTTGQVSDMLEMLVVADNKEKLTLDHLDAKHKVQFTLLFTGLQVIEHTTKYDYKSNDVLTHRVRVSFKKMERKTPGLKEGRGLVGRGVGEK